MIGELTIERIREAQRRIAPHVIRTPVLRHRGRRGELFLKAESLQPTGAFKLRGAFNRMLRLPGGCPGVVAHSSGNHGRAVARAARVLGLHALIVMPSDAPDHKREAARVEGAQIVTVGRDSEERARRAERLARERGWELIPPFDDPDVVAGQGTAALELCEEVAPAGGLAHFYAPIGGGGLMAGCAVAFAALCPGVEIVGVEPEARDSVRRSLAEGRRLPCAQPPDTLADGLRVRAPGVRPWPLLHQHLTRVEAVGDAALLEAMAFALRELRLVLEPSGAAALAVALREDLGASGVLLSGGNVDPELLARVAALAHR
ncbi:MAG: threonine/serine dehydratase [Myxococcota bacterium]